MDYFYVDISTELGESLTTYVQANLTKQPGLMRQTEYIRI